MQTLDLTGRVRVVHARAEDAGRMEGLRGGFDLVVARSFGKPAVTAECAAPFLRVGGVLRVSEPPDPGDRWPEAGVAQLGLTVGRRIGLGDSHVQELLQAAPCPERFPRRDGQPAKAPLF